MGKVSETREQYIQWESECPETHQQYNHDIASLQAVGGKVYAPAKCLISYEVLPVVLVYSRINVGFLGHSYKYEETLG